MDYLKTASGKLLECGQCSAINTWKGPLLQIKVRVPMAQAAVIFTDPEETKQLWYCDRYYAGFTRLSALVQQDSFVQIGLEKE